MHYNVNGNEKRRNVIIFKIYIKKWVFSCQASNVSGETSAPMVEFTTGAPAASGFGRAEKYPDIAARALKGDPGKSDPHPRLSVMMIFRMTLRLPVLSIPRSVSGNASVIMPTNFFCEYGFRPDSSQYFL